ncbi:MAG: ABC transporter permease subunit [Candidatus Sericytochromatia bacterium]|nr:ABC transporter permease subunit [Candidatus Sericytochromatia bacterium]
MMEPDGHLPPTAGGLFLPFLMAGWHLRLLLAARATRWILLAWVVLVAVCASGGALAGRAERAAHDAVEASLPRFHEAWAAAYGQEAYRPVHFTAEHPLVLHLAPAPGRALAGGVGDAVGAWAQPTGYHVRELEGRRPAADPTAGRLDLTALVVGAGALLALALGHDALAGERDRATLALHDASGVGPLPLLLGKWGGVLAAAAVVLLLPVALAVAALGAAGELGGGGWALGLAYVGLCAAYVGAWGTLGLAISCWSRAASTALVAGVALWVLAGVVAPRALGTFADRRHVVAPPAGVEQALQGVLASAKAAYRVRLAAARAEHGALDAGDLAALRLAYHEDYYARASRLLQPVERALAARRAWLDGACWLTPSLGFQLAACRLAGTDGTRHHAFREAADRHASTLRRWVDLRVLAGKPGRPTWGELPPFSPAEAAPGARLGGALAALVAWTLCGLLLGWLGLVTPRNR